MRGLNPQMVEHRRTIVSHVLQLVRRLHLFLGPRLFEGRADIRRSPVIERGREAAIAIVIRDDPEAPARQFLDQPLAPGRNLHAEPADQQHRRPVIRPIGDVLNLDIHGGWCAGHGLVPLTSVFNCPYRAFSVRASHACDGRSSKDADLERGREYKTVVERIDDGDFAHTVFLILDTRIVAVARLSSKFFV